MIPANLDVDLFRKSECISELFCLSSGVASYLVKRVITLVKLWVCFCTGRVAVNWAAFTQEDPESKTNLTGGLPWWSSGQDSTLPLRRAWVRSLVWELRSHKLCGEAKEKKTNKDSQESHVTKDSENRKFD